MRFSIPDRAHVTLVLRDARGRHVRTLRERADRSRLASTRSEWTGRRLRAGLLGGATRGPHDRRGVVLVDTGM